MCVAIIGAGIAGLSCASALSDHGYDVVLLDKGRGPGGRLSSCQLDCEDGPAVFDHGAQYFTARDPRFQRVVAGWANRGVAAQWPVAGLDAWVGFPRMDAIVQDLASHQAVEFEYLAKGIFRVENSWWVTGDRGVRGPFQAVILATPAEQAAPILSLHDFGLARAAIGARSQPCWSIMFAFAARVPISQDIVRDFGPIAWAARNSAKPARGSPECWVIQANATWSAGHQKLEPGKVRDVLEAAFRTAVGAPLPDLLCGSAHRWRYALASGTGDGALWNSVNSLGVCGDWLIGPRVECAWLSGQKLAELVIRSGLPVQFKATEASVHAAPTA